MCARLHGSTKAVAYLPISLAVIAALGAAEALARSNIRDAFFAVYPDAVGTTIETVPSHVGHCGVCHYEFAGGGPRNPYGARLELALPDFSSNPNGRQQAVQSIENEDPDADGFSTLIEVTDTTNFSNTPTFPGLTPANVQNATSVDISEIQTNLVPSAGGDTTPPDVTVIAPNGGEVFVGNSATTVQWSATDTSGIAAIDIHLSDDNGLTFKPIALGLSNTGSHTWFVANRPTALAIVRVLATDNAFNTGQDDSDAVFTVESPPGGIVPTTLRDFDQPGSQPFEAGILNPPEACAVCHGNYDSSVEPYFNWQGTLMAQASRDVIFLANMVIANQDAPDSGDMCLRCHFPRGWLQGRSVPTDGSQMLPTDYSGVSCDFCHRLVDPIYDPTENPQEDEAILADLSFPASDFGNGMATIDPTGARRGPFLNAATGHPVLVSPFHREAALCGTCHDVSNPAFEKDGSGNYVPNTFDAPATDFSAHTIAPVERTYSEWFYSEYNTPDGVYAPEFGGNLDYVSTCQDCHMRDVTGEGCNFGTPPTRDDLPLHDITGGSTWLPGLLGTLFPGEVNETALQTGIDRARYMLQNAAELAVIQEGTQLKVTITNNTGHKLPTGYPEGRRMWINVKFYDAGMALVSESGAYDPSTGILGHDAEAKIYDVEPGLDSITAPLVGVDPGPSFHFVLNNKTFKDNRIPPRGFTNAAYAAFGGSPVAHSYSDGQYWDDTFYNVPPGATSAEVTLYYQSTSKEFIEFLRDENTTDTKGQEIYDLWNNNDKCPPELMQHVVVTVEPAEACCLPDGTCQNLNESECLAANGSPYPGGLCTTSEACCYTGGACLDLDPVCCLGTGGHPHGTGTECATAECAECYVDADCNDDNACTDDTCPSGSCVYTDTTPPGQCCDPVTGTLTPIDDGNDCTDDVCNLDGTVSHTPFSAGTPCDDGNACTTNDVCPGDETGTCQGTDTSAVDCEDGNVCTVDTCDPITGCLNNGTGVTDPCDDGDPCTANDVCQGDEAGTCAGTTSDADGDTVPDACDNCPDHANTDQADCDEDGTGDVCTIADCQPDDVTCQDCQPNGIPDACDLVSGPSRDDNGNGIPDECECFASSQPEPERLDLPLSPESRKIRYLSFSAGDFGRSQAVRVTFSDVPSPYDHWNGTELWVQQPQEYCENAGTAQGDPCPLGAGGLPSPVFWGADLGCVPYWTDWTQYDLVHVFNEGIIPSGVYDLQVIDSSCSQDAEGHYSPALTITQSTWADLVQDCSTTPCKPPDGSTGIVDITAILDKWKNLPGNVKKVRADIEGSPAGDHRLPDQSINITDVTYCLSAFLGDTYPGPGFPAPSDPPSCP